MSGRTPKEIRLRREQSKLRKDDPKRSHWLNPLGLSIGILSLVLTAIALLLELQAGPTVLLGAPLDPNDLLTTPVELANDGYLDLKDVRVESFELVRFAGTVTSSRNIASNYVEPNKTLKTGESETVPLSAFTFDSPTDSEDIALIAFYRTAFMPFLPKRRAFRFKSVSQSDGRLRLVKQPAGDALDRYDQIVRHQETFGRVPPAR